MAYLDLTPMLQAMRARPSEFEMYGPFLQHIRSQHLLEVDRRGNVRVHARCDCAMLEVSREQGEEMMAAPQAGRLGFGSRPTSGCSSGERWPDLSTTSLAPRIPAAISSYSATGVIAS